MFHPTSARASAWFGLLVMSLAACGSADRPSTDRPTTTGPSPSTSVQSPPAGAETTNTAETARTIEATFARGQVIGGSRRETVRLGERVRLRVTSDVDDEVHVHTYDAKVAVMAGRPAELEVIATIPGRHEVELEQRHRQLLTLEVR